MYVDVHAHLDNEAFLNDIDDTVSRMKVSNVRVIANGINHQSNQKVLDLASKYEGTIEAACGVYPVDAMVERIDNLPYKVERFDVRKELDFIEELARTRKIVAIGEIGLDGYWLDESSFNYQEEVFRIQIEIARTYNLPIIIHSRKLEGRCVSILEEYKNSFNKVVLHCFCGGADLVRKVSENFEWMFSIPVNIVRNKNFINIVKKVDITRLLTETDSPYLNSESGVRNEPINVIKTVEFIAKIKEEPISLVEEVIYNNYKRMFKI